MALQDPLLGIAQWGLYLSENEEIEMAYNEKRKLITGTARLSFANIWEPRESGEGDNKRKTYSCMLLIPKTDTATINAIREAQNAALEDLLGVGKGLKDGKFPPGWKNTFRDGDEEKDLEEFPEYAGMMFLNVSANEGYPPGVVDQRAKPIVDRAEVYSGCYVRAQLAAFAFKGEQSKGVSFGLRHLQKVKDGEPFGDGGEKAEDVFTPIVDEDGADDLI